MTRNQIDYWANLEKRRANITDEYLTYLDLGERIRHQKQDEFIRQYQNQTNRMSYEESVRHDKESEAISWFHENENKRHNQEGENISWFNAFEGKRHNMEGENISWFNAYEGQRHNMEGEKISWFDSLERERHNVVDENEKHRHQVEEEGLTLNRQAYEQQHWQRQDAASAIQAKASSKQAEASESQANSAAKRVEVDKTEVKRKSLDSGLTWFTKAYDALRGQMSLSSSDAIKILNLLQ